MDLSNAVGQLYRQWEAGRQELPVGKGPQEDIAPGIVETYGTLEEALETAWQEIREYLQAMNPYDFQNLVAGLLRGMGYYVSWVAPPGKDGGIDIIAFTDPIGAVPPRILVQVRRRESKATRDDLRSFLAIVGGNDVGLFVSSSGFTSDAETEARSQGMHRRVTLLSMERLFDLWVENYAKIPESERNLLPLKPVYYLLPRGNED